MLDRLRVEVRARTPWEAVDLAFVLLRSQAGKVFPVFLILTLPPALALSWFLRSTPWLTPLILWWLKPLLDRPVLHILAKGTFGEAPGVLATLRQLPTQVRKGLIAQLLWRRVDLERSLLLPVWQLEDPDGKAFRARRRILVRRGRAQAQLLTVVCFLFQALAFVVAVAFLAYFWPAGDFKIMEAIFRTEAPRIPLLDAFLWLLPTLAMILVEPFYVAAGFGLYLNRRVQLEGWDLELAFRHLGERARRMAARGLGACFLAFLMLAPMALRAAPSPREEIKEVLKAPEFAGTRKEWAIRLRNPTPDPVRKSSTTPPWLKRLSALLGIALKWVIPFLLVAALVYFLWKNRETFLASVGTLEPLRAPDQLFGLDIRPAALPRDIPRAADELWEAGDPRGALSLLYRGALAHLVHRLRTPLGPGSTEGDCLDLARGALPETGWQYFARLTGTWRGLAYGGRSATPGDRALCAEWGTHFTGGMP